VIKHVLLVLLGSMVAFGACAQANPASVGPAASPQTEADRTRLCTTVSNLEIDIAKDRDRGVSRDVTLKKIVAMRKSDPLWNTVLGYVWAFAQTTYDHPDVPPDEIKKQTFDSCMRLLFKSPTAANSSSKQVR